MYFFASSTNQLMIVRCSIRFVELCLTANRKIKFTRIYKIKAFQSYDECRQMIVAPREMRLTSNLSWCPSEAVGLYKIQVLSSERRGHILRS